jgi:hypothetical protein
MNTIIIVILSIVGALLIIALLVYLIGNVYKGLVNRKQVMNHSYNELCKYLDKLFDLIPGVFQNCELNQNQETRLKDIFDSYNNMRRDITPSQYCTLFLLLKDLLQELQDTNIDNEALDYALEILKRTNFSVPLYNSNVKAFNKFKHLPINNIVSKMLKYDDGLLFRKDITHSTTTINFKFEK